MSSRILVVYSPRQVAGHRYLGDKRSGIVYDLAAVSSEGGDEGGGSGGERGEGGERGGERGGEGGEHSEGGLALRSLVDELLASERYICFAPDTLAEARNRGYRPCSRRALRKALRRI